MPVSIDFLSSLKGDDLFHNIAYDYTCADGDGLCDQEMFYGRISLNIGASVAASDFVSWFRLDLMCIPLIINMR